MTPLTRRQFLAYTGAAGLSALGASFPRIVSGSELNEPFQRLPSTADSVILIWLAGGAAHTETFDPKPVTPFKKGLDSRAVLSTYPSIPTAVDDVFFSEGLDSLASVMDRGTVLRSMYLPNLGPVIHTRYQYLWHTGYIPPQSIAAPHIGSVISKILGPNSQDAPAFVDTGQPLEGDGTAEINAFMTSGFLGIDHSPFRVPVPADAAKRVTFPTGFDSERFDHRHNTLQKIARNSPFFESLSGHQQDGVLRTMEDAKRLLHSPAAKAFNINLEPKASFAKYDTGAFGQGCLLARRLIEAGTRFVEVSSGYIAFGSWDTHRDGHKRTRGLKKNIDAPIAQLVLDLEERGLLERTLVVVASEFSRTSGRNPGKSGVKPEFILKNQNQYGMHRHFAEAGSVLLFGGGVKRGSVYGKTADEFPCQTVEKPVSIEDLHATIYRALGISPKLSFEFEKRPFFVTNNGEGKVIGELFERGVV